MWQQSCSLWHESTFLPKSSRGKSAWSNKPKGGDRRGDMAPLSANPACAAVSRGDYARNERIGPIPSRPGRFRDLPNFWKICFRPLRAPASKFGCLASKIWCLSRLVGCLAHEVGCLAPLLGKSPLGETPLPPPPPTPPRGGSALPLGQRLR